MGVKFTPCWFSLDNSETVKAVTVTFCSIQEDFVQHICAKCSIPNSSDIGKNADRGISNFWISGPSFLNKNCHNSRTNHDIDIKRGPVTKFGKTNTKTSKWFDDNVMLANWDLIVFFSIYGQFAAIQKPNSRRMIYKTYIFINNNLLIYKIRKQNSALILWL